MEGLRGCEGLWSGRAAQESYGEQGAACAPWGWRWRAGSTPHRCPPVRWLRGPMWRWGLCVHWGGGDGAGRGVGQCRRLCRAGSGVLGGCCLWVRSTWGWALGSAWGSWLCKGTEQWRACGAPPVSRVPSQPWLGVCCFLIPVPKARSGAWLCYSGWRLPRLRGRWGCAGQGMPGDAAASQGCSASCSDAACIWVLMGTGHGSPRTPLTLFPGLPLALLCQLPAESTQVNTTEGISSWEVSVPSLRCRAFPLPTPPRTGTLLLCFLLCPQKPLAEGGGARPGGAGAALPCEGRARGAAHR